MKYTSCSLMYANELGVIHYVESMVLFKVSKKCRQLTKQLGTSVKEKP